MLFFSCRRTIVEFSFCFEKSELQREPNFLLVLFLLVVVAVASQFIYNSQYKLKNMFSIRSLKLVASNSARMGVAQRVKLLPQLTANFSVSIEDPPKIHFKATQTAHPLFDKSAKSAKPKGVSLLVYYIIYKVSTALIAPPFYLTSIYHLSICRTMRWTSTCRVTTRADSRTTSGPRKRSTRPWAHFTATSPSLSRTI
jgi:hypothetical protein